MRPLSTVGVLVLPFMLSAALIPAQTMTATGSFNISVSAGGNFDMRPGPFPGPVSAAASSGNDWVSGTGRGSLQGLSGSVSVSSSSSCQPFTQCGVSATCDGSVLFEVFAPVPTSGVVSVTTIQQGAVDIGDDGTEEVPYSASAQIPVVVTSAGFPIRVRVHAFRFGATSNDGSVSLRFTPGPSALTPYGPTCNSELGAAVVRGASSDVLMFLGGQSPNSPYALLIVGITLLNVPIPPTQCPLLTDLAIVVPIAIAGGESSSRFVIPHIPGLMLLGQIIVSETPPPDVRWRTSNGVRIALP